MTGRRIAQTGPTSRSLSPGCWPTCSRPISKQQNFVGTCRGRTFRHYHLLLHELATQILATTDIIAERVRKLGGQTINSIGHIGRLEQIQDHNAAEVAPREMLTELLEDHRLVIEQMLKMQALCDERGEL
jgi:starvation-inducible DNA-binding protein